MFDNPDIFYCSDPKIIFDNNWLINPIGIENLKKHKFIVIDFSFEHYGVAGLDHVYHALESAGINFLLLTHDPMDHLKFPRMLFYPYYYHFSRQQFVMAAHPDPLIKTHKWGCLNANPRPHRIYNYIYSQQQSYFESAWFSFHNASDGATRPDDVVLDQEIMLLWNNQKSALQDRFYIKSQEQLYADCNLPAIVDSYVHLVTETTVIPKIFITEKTWKPIAAGQLFLIFGNPGIVDYLRNQGVDVFDDIIDHSYDQTQDWQARLHAIHKQLENLVKQDLKDIYINTQQRRQTNVENFFAGKFDQQYLQTITQCVNNL